MIFHPPEIFTCVNGTEGERRRWAGSGVPTVGKSMFWQHGYRLDRPVPPGRLHPTGPPGGSVEIGVTVVHPTGSILASKEESFGAGNFFANFRIFTYFRPRFSSQGGGFSSCFAGMGPWLRSVQLCKRTFHVKFGLATAGSDKQYDTSHREGTVVHDSPAYRVVPRTLSHKSWSPLPWPCPAPAPFSPGLAASAPWFCQLQQVQIMGLLTLLSH